jgi:Protein tyrosine and serine/threonine kinase
MVFTVWSFGMVLWECFSGGRLPFYDYVETREVVHAIVDRHELPAQPAKCPNEVYEIMKRCWARSGKDRPSFQELFFEIKTVRGLRVLTHDREAVVVSEGYDDA